MADKNPIGHSVKGSNGGDVHTLSPVGESRAGAGKGKMKDTLGGGTCKSTCQLVVECKAEIHFAWSWIYPGKTVLLPILRHTHCVYMKFLTCAAQGLLVFLSVLLHLDPRFSLPALCILSLSLCLYLPISTLIMNGLFLFLTVQVQVYQ